LKKSDSLINIIYIDNGLYSNDEHFPLTIPSNTKLIGKNMNSVIVDANYKSRVIVVENSNNVIIQNITITKGQYFDSLVINKENPRVVRPENAYGQGLYCNKSVVSIDSVFITNNGNPDDWVCNSFGIGCYFKNSIIKIRNSDISSNYIKTDNYNGGGIYVDSSELCLYNVKIHNHISPKKNVWFYGSNGGGFYGNSSNIIMEKTKIYNNYCENIGSAIVAYNCKLKLNQCEIFQNHIVADYHFSGSLCYFAHATNCSVSNSIIHSNNGAVYNTNLGYEPHSFLFSMDHTDSLTLNNVTITNNNINYKGSVVFGSNKLKVLNSIIWSNNFSFYVEKRNVSFSDIQGLPDSLLNSNNINKDPLFNDSIPYVLSSKSPCINKGKNIDYNPQTDYIDNPRIFGGQIDMSALEYQNY